MGNELTLASLTNLPTTKRKVDLSDYGSGGEYLSRLQLVNPQSKYAAKGIAPAGNWVIPVSEDQVVDLGNAIDIRPWSVRDKAMDTTGDKPIISYDPDSPLFQDIKKRAGVKDSGCMFGPSFLVEERSTGRFLELYFGNKSGRFEAENMGQFLPVSEDDAKELGIEARLPSPCTVTTVPLEGDRSFWYAPKLNICSTPFDDLSEAKAQALAEEVVKFVTEESSDVTVAAAAETTSAPSGGRRRSR